MFDRYLDEDRSTFVASFIRVFCHKKVKAREVNNSRDKIHQSDGSRVKNKKGTLCQLYNNVSWLKPIKRKQ